MRSGEKARLAIGRPFIRAHHPGVVSEADAHVGDHARNHLVEVGLDAGEGNHDAAPFNATPEGRIAREEEVRHTVRPIVVAAVPELERLAPRDAHIVILPGTGLAKALLVERVGMKRIVWPGRIIFGPLIFHGGNDDNDMAHLARG